MGSEQQTSMDRCSVDHYAQLQETVVSDQLKEINQNRLVMNYQVWVIIG